jgi:hypothetical protein
MGAVAIYFLIALVVVAAMAYWHGRGGLDRWDFGLWPIVALFWPVLVPCALTIKLFMHLGEKSSYRAERLNRKKYDNGL